MKTKIFGEHDEATIAQIDRGMAAGGERAVLCVDGHKGYAQPIGGVVAYEEKISLSGASGSTLRAETSPSARTRPVRKLNRRWKRS
ncbi:MAG TPA: hypothetical protein VF345_02165 [Chthoniobacterales bacterium]